MIKKNNTLKFILKIKKVTTAFSLLLMFVCGSTYSQTNVFRVTLDAGHGDHDFGATYNGHVEKNINLAIVLKVGKLLEQNPKIEVNYTRKTDVFIDLIERANIANRVNANIFVSIHCNANRNTAADGTETYVMGMNKVASNLAVAKSENSVITLEKDYKQKYEGFDPNSPETMLGVTLMQEEYLDNSISLASLIEDKFAALGKKIRQGGVKQAPFMVLHKAYMPRVLIETGFISNTIEGNLLDSEDGQNEIANAIASAIISYKNEYFGSGSGEQDIVFPPKKVVEKSIKDTSSPSQSSQITDSTKTNAVNKVSDSNGVVFKVQLMASTKKVELSPKNFNGLKKIAIDSSSSLYKYTYGETNDYNEAKRLLQEAKAKGYESAYVIAFKNGIAINVQDVINN
jgi:N-acetylmuramoyl-L-alanine amidase